VNRRLLQLLLLITTSLTLGACSEEYYGQMVCKGGLDTLIVYPRQEVQHVTVIGDESGMAGMESLYLGSSGGTRSDILVNFDFSDVISEDYPDSLFEVSNIISVKLALIRLRRYAVSDDSSSTTGIIYHVKALDKPFDSEEYTTWPGPEPSTDDLILNSDFTELNYRDEPYLKLHPEDLSDWVRNRGTVGMVITAAEGSDEGLVGFASRELTNNYALPPLVYGSTVAPTIIVQFHNYPNYDQFFQIPPGNDTSSFESVASLPPEMAHVQTGLRSYPVLTFDIPALPAESSKYVAYGFRFSADSIDSFWTGSCLDLSQLDPRVLEGVTEPVLAADLEAAASDLFRICPGREEDGDPNLFTLSELFMHWEPAPPRVMNVMLTYSHNWRNDAAVYFTQSTFFGPGAAIEYRPILLVITCNRGE